MIIHRLAIERSLYSALARSPAVALLGARQVGKTTLARQLAREVEGAVYLDLEKVSDLRKLEDAGAYLRAQAGHLTIIDEIHRAPGLFAELRSIIDERREAGERAGQFLLLGSASLDLVQKTSETLAGRVTYLEMNPINLPEAAAAHLSTEQLWVRGGFPDSLTATTDENSFYWRQDFIRSYLERDVPMFVPRMPSALIGRLWTMLANGQGTLLNSARLAQALGVSAPMITRYIACRSTAGEEVATVERQSRQATGSLTKNLCTGLRSRSRIGRNRHSRSFIRPSACWFELGRLSNRKFD